ncbi:MAG: hypothetical protein J7M12_01920, partial [Candidatus Hydrogenedentes bacterium]|nr:hypothetical protein [Candidatus Hydrogenedentota bacterium]
MATLGSYTFDAEHTSITDTVDEVAGRTRRVFVVSGLIVGKTTETDIVDELDAIADAVPAGEWTMLSVRLGRFLKVERIEMSRRIDRRELIGSFTLRLAAADPFERSADVSVPVWQVESSGATKTVAAGGTIWSELTVEMVAAGNVVNPAIGDGVRTIQYLGTV